ncbi:MAG: DNA alkylation repair protein [Ilumatobacter sp.]
MRASIDDLRRRLESLADPVNAAPMAAYMRDRFEFLGVKTPERRATSREMIRDSRQWDVDDVVDGAVELRSLPQREFHYVASDLLARNASRLRATDLAAMQRLVTLDAWWDTVDALASPTIGEMVLTHDAVSEAMDEWIGSDDIWVARVALIHQLRFKERTDVDRLFAYSLRRADDTELFIRKAIGWALRQYARTEPGAVRSFIDEHTDRFSGLTIREATKHL